MPQETIHIMTTYEMIATAIPHYTLDFWGIMGYNFVYNSFTGEVYHGTV